MHSMRRRLSGREQMLRYAGICLLPLVLLLSGCGFNDNSTNSSRTGSDPTRVVTPTVVKGYGTNQGCASDVVMDAIPTRPNVTVTDKNTVVKAKVNQIIEVALPFGFKWKGPQTVPAALQMESPAGFAWKQDNVCIWRFKAVSVGTVELEFSKQPLCKKGEMCAMYIALLPLKVEITA